MKTRKNLSTPLASTCFRGSSSPSCSCACLYCWKLISSLVISPSIFVFTFPASFRLHSWRLPFPSRALSPDFHAIRQPMPARSDSFAFGFRIFRGASATRAAFLRLAHVGIGCLSIHTPLHHFLPHLSISLLYTLGVGGAPICRHIPISLLCCVTVLPSTRGRFAHVRSSRPGTSRGCALDLSRRRPKWGGLRVSRARVACLNLPIVRVRAGRALAKFNHPFRSIICTTTD